jgi:hypothetical protein
VDEAARGQLRLALAEVSSLAALSDKSSFSGPPTLSEPMQQFKQQNRKLSQRQSEQRAQIRKIKFILEALTQPTTTTTNDDEGASSTTTRTDNSGLTSQSYYSTEVKNHNARGWGFLVDRTPATSMMKAAVENLELNVIFKYGASYDFARRYPNLASTATTAPDNDLDVIIAWAASQESEKSVDETDAVAVASTYSPVRPAVAAQSSRPSRHQHHRDIELPALLPAEDDDDETLSFHEESHHGSQEDRDVDDSESYEEDPVAELLSETQVSI